MKMWLALDTPCSDPQSEAALWSGLSPVVCLFWAQEAHFFMKKNCLPGAELMGGRLQGPPISQLSSLSWELLQRQGAGHLLFIVWLSLILLTSELLF